MTRIPGTARSLISVLAIAMLWTVAVTGAAPGAGYAQASDGMANKVVWHADFSDPRRFSAMLASVYNMVAHYDGNLLDHDVRIVFNSHGIRFLTDDPLEGTPFAADEALAERRQDLKNRLLSLRGTYGVTLELCDITRRAAGLARDKLYPGVEAVESGVVRIAELQHQGFAYIKVE